MPKSIKSAAELVDIIMVELRKHPECDAVQRIAIIRPVTKNWDVTILRSYQRVCPPACHKILEATLQRPRTLYDLPGRK
jgi:hypothetical protein